MAILKCKMCGGNLVFRSDTAVAECEYCGTVQTVPAADNEKMLALFSRAHRLRAECEFDKAAGIYESITVDFPQEAEAYWGLILCKYGIEYVDDPRTGSKVPTCHRSSFDSILSDSNLELVLRYAQQEALPLYRQEAGEIEELRKSIIAVSSHEEPYDIFICYKETDKKGQRTLDSVLAQDVYDALTARGYRVFFSRISLEDAIGKEYEPYIFAALHSAKVMLAFSTDPRHLDSVWVKNEWSRFLSLIAKGEQKYLIPCYKGISIGDLPPQFARLQAQDLGKVGAIQDLIRGIDKLLRRPELQNPDIPQPKRSSRTWLWVTAAVIAALAGILAFTLPNQTQMSPAALYTEAKEHLQTGMYTEADQILLELTQAGESPEALTQLYLDHVLELLLNDSADSGQQQEAVQKYRDFLLTLQEWGIEESRLSEIQENFLTEQYQTLLQQKQYDKILLLHEMLGLGSAPEEVLQARYATAKDLLQAGNPEAAIALFSELGDYLDSAHQLILAQTELSCRQASPYDAAMSYYGLKAVPGAWERCTELWNQITPRSSIAVSSDYIAVIRQDGSVADYDISSGTANTDRIKNVSNLVSIAAGTAHTVGLKADGTVIAARLPQSQHQKNQCYVSHWSDVVAIAANEYHTMGLKADGTVVATGAVATPSFYDVSGWKDIVAIAAGTNHAVGLKKDGTVVAAGWNVEGQCEVSGWQDIVAIAAGHFHTVGLKSDGTLVIAGNSGDGRSAVTQWTEITAIASGRNHIVGLKKDGTAVAAGLHTENHQLPGADLAAIAAGGNSSFALGSDGTLVYAPSLSSRNIPLWDDIHIPGM